MINETHIDEEHSEDTYSEGQLFLFKENQAGLESVLNLPRLLLTLARDVVCATRISNDACLPRSIVNVVSICARPSGNG
jgi:hypothetical protein